MHTRWVVVSHESCSHVERVQLSLWGSSLGVLQHNWAVACIPVGHVVMWGYVSGYPLSECVAQVVQCLFESPVALMADVA